MPDRETLLHNAITVADAMVALFGTRVEVVVHDVPAATIRHIANPLSHRTVGDPSNIDDIDVNTGETIIGPYEKINWDGSLIRSISIVQRAVDGSVPFLICVNFDQSDLQAAQRAMQALMPAAPSIAQPEALFRKDWHERVNVFVTEWCATHDTGVGTLTKPQRKDLLRALEASGALAERNAAAYVARVLGISRATVYNDLRKEPRQ